MRSFTFLVMVGLAQGVALAQVATAAVAEAADEVAARSGSGAPSGTGDAAPGGVIRLDETVISGNQELPKVLYILPWREPSGLPEIELDAGQSELDVFRRLYPPAYRRELTYFESLEQSNPSPAAARSKEE